MGGSKGGKSSGGDTTVRYAPYLEGWHNGLIQAAADNVIVAQAGNPYAAYITADPTFDAVSTLENSFFSSGYTIASFPSVYDMFGKFVAGLDIEVLYEQIYDAMVNDPVTNDMIATEAAYLDDEIEQTSLPRIKAGMRDMNAVMSSSFIYATTLVENQRTKAINKFAADVKMRAMELTLNRWAKHLEWNGNVISQYAGLNKAYWATKFDYVNVWEELHTKNVLWVYTLIDHVRSVLGALNGATAAKVQGQSSGQKAMNAIAGGLGGAAMGAYVLPALFPAVSAGTAAAGSATAGMSTGAMMGGLTGPWGAAIGAAIGVGLSFLE